LKEEPDLVRLCIAGRAFLETQPGDIAAVGVQVDLVGAGLAVKDEADGLGEGAELPELEPSGPLASRLK